MSSIRYSLIVPTFGRPEEVSEFLLSLYEQKFTDFEVILADGTPGDKLRPELERFIDKAPYPVRVIYEEFLPVSDARNEGAKVARGSYFIFLDSDCIIPPDYLYCVDRHVSENNTDVFGGPDRAAEDFTILQKAISYAMTSIITTGGIRGNKNHVGTYHPRGFNMGMKREAFEAVGGYSDLRCGEDVDLSIRLIQAKYKTEFIEEAFVYHKRRTSLKKFYRQVYRFGAARINLARRHRGELKPTHYFPAVFSLVFLLNILALIVPFGFVLATPMAIYLLLVGILATGKENSLEVGVMAVAATVCMHLGYGTGFVRNAWHWRKYGRSMNL